MSREDQLKWDSRYAEADFVEGRTVTACVLEWLDQAPKGRALDIACGSGRNAIHLAQRGFEVDAIDISAVGLAHARAAAERVGVAVNWIVHDLDAGLPVSVPYQLILQLHYINTAVTQAAVRLLAPGGLLICQQHLRTDEAVGGPQSPQFRVAPGELRALAEGLEILHLEERVEERPGGVRMALATLVARRKTGDPSTASAALP